MGFTVGETEGETLGATASQSVGDTFSSSGGSITEQTDIETADGPGYVISTCNVDSIKRCLHSSS
jgi:hypothetical protein